MNPNEEALIASLHQQAKDHEPTLKPHSLFEGKYSVNAFYVDDHTDLLLTVRAMIHLAMRVIDPELFGDDISQKNETAFVRQVLIIANRLMPKGEEALLDLLNLYYRDEKLREDIK
ncbi:hypothetical protein RM545_15760 [Zunongwangia sp. F260]|uniref:Uncharacterized protein n=1 Tax=Autumnicola lenta TaxID=3075593 RepID=A0ABU3CPE1_9FLAO|nr:hypothetical protein [Zunongwangia sp. F260]MDT0648151.1 hypothetical protein [Zunongwangia sp. F260]